MLGIWGKQDVMRDNKKKERMKEEKSGPKEQAIAITDTIARAIVWLLIQIFSFDL